MHAHAAITCLLIAALLAGCTGEPPKDDIAELPTEPGPDDEGTEGNPPRIENGNIDVTVLVLDEALAPIIGAEVTLWSQNLTKTTDAQGTAVFFQVPAADAVQITAEASGFQARSVTIVPATTPEVEFQLAAGAPEPFSRKTEFSGYFDCAVEVLIIPGSCDLLVETAGGPDILAEDASHIHPLTADWKTIVASVHFDANPGLDGLRVTLRGGADPDAVGEYEQYARFSGPDDFTFRFEPAQTYPDGAAEVPEDLRALQFDFYPHGHGWHATCEAPAPESAPCLLGVGASGRLEFTMILTTFYGEPAPEGFTHE